MSQGQTNGHGLVDDPRPQPSSPFVKFQRWESENDSQLKLLSQRQEVQKSPVKKDLAIIVKDKAMKANAVIKAWSSDENEVTHVGFDAPKASSTFTMTSIEESATDYKSVIKPDHR